MALEARIRELEKATQALDPDAAERARLERAVLAYASAHVQDRPQMPVYQSTPDQGAGLYDSPLSEEPIAIEAALQLLRDHVDRVGVTIGSPGHLAYIPSGALYVPALGDYLAAVSSRYVGLFFAAPGAVRMEHMLLRFFADEIGYPATAAGDLTSGGSIANLEGIVTAREASGLTAKDFARAVVYLSEQTHHAIAKALRIAGLGECQKRYVPLDAQYRMQAAALAAAIAADRQQGFLPWLIVATAGSTDTGAVDPLPAIADLAEQNGLWLHVDGAYGAAFVLCPPGRQILRGLERSDSVVLDPHKGLSIPLGLGALLVKDGAKLQQAHHYSANYLQDAAVADEISPAELSVELSRPFRGLRLWLPMKLAGVAPFRAALEEKLLLARYFHQQIQQIPGFEVGPAPDLSVVTFRYLPARGDANAFNQQLVTAIRDEGKIFLSSTLIDRQFTLRLAILGLRTHLDTIDLALEVLERQAKRLRTT